MYRIAVLLFVFAVFCVPGAAQAGPDERLYVIEGGDSGSGAPQGYWLDDNARSGPGEENPPLEDGEGNAVACTMEAKICPDGTAVSRTGPNCEFAPCPGGAGEAPGVAPANPGAGGGLMMPSFPRDVAPDAEGE